TPSLMWARPASSTAFPPAFSPCLGKALPSGDWHDAGDTDRRGQRESDQEPELERKREGEHAASLPSRHRPPHLTFSPASPDPPCPHRCADAPPCQARDCAGRTSA